MPRPRFRPTAPDGPQVLAWVAVAGFVLVVYLVVVVGLGGLLDRGRSAPDLALSVLATCLVAVGIEPVRARALPPARRLLGGGRATPYEALSAFSAQAGQAYPLDEVLPRTAHVLAAGTGAQATEVWLRVGARLLCGATWPPSPGPAVARLDVRHGVLVAAPPADAVVPVRHHGELLGALVVRKREDEPLTPVERALLGDLAGQAGLVLRNVALTEELAARLEQIQGRSQELAASRHRIVAAQDRERRRLERDIHDGAQQHLVALAVNLALLRTLLGRSPARALPVLAELPDAVAAAEATLRDLARGVYPRTLTRSGLVAALREAVAGAPLPVTVSGGPQRHPEQVEVAAYFCCLEAVQNAVKHAGARDVTIWLDGDGASAGFTVRDDGTGFLPSAARAGAGLDNMADRVEALGGTLTVTSAPGAGTTVTGRLPYRAGRPPAAATPSGEAER